MNKAVSNEMATKKEARKKNTRASNIAEKKVSLPAAAFMLCVPILTNQLFLAGLSPDDISKLFVKGQSHNAAMIVELIQESVFRACKIASGYKVAEGFLSAKSNREQLEWLFVILKTMLFEFTGTLINDREINTLATDATFVLALNFPNLSAKIELEKKGRTYKQLVRSVRRDGVARYRGLQKKRKDVEVVASQLQGFFESFGQSPQP